MTNALKELMDWYESNCDGDWEHQQGVTIATVDNPGWSIKVDLVGTPLEGRKFPFMKRERGEEDWILALLHDDGATFYAAGGPQNLEEIIAVFCDWANKTQ
jgi:hypothetical protein